MKFLVSVFVDTKKSDRGRHLQREVDRRQSWI